MWRNTITIASRNSNSRTAASGRGILLDGKRTAYSIKSMLKNASSMYMSRAKNSVAAAARDETSSTSRFARQAQNSSMFSDISGLNSSSRT